MSTGQPTVEIGAGLPGGGRVFGFDLVRMLAILCVLQVHFLNFILETYGRKQPAFTEFLGGMGAESLFVLSGFLIGWLLIEVIERTPTRRGWFIFMVRRWMRTIPIYVLWVGVMLLVVRFHHEQAIAYLTFTQNVAWPLVPDSWFPASWSLSIEEWFYLIFSAIVIGLAPFWPRRSLPLACAVFIIVPVTLRWLNSDMPDLDAGMRQVLIYRMDAIAYGVLMVLLYLRYRAFFDRFRLLLLPIGIVLSLALLYPNIAPTWLNFTLGPVGFALCLPAALALPRPWAAVESIVYWMSTRSYGMYLGHQTFMFLASSTIRHELLPPPLAFAAMTLGTFLSADLLYRFFESPIMKLRPRQFAKKRAEARNDEIVAIPAGHPT